MPARRRRAAVSVRADTAARAAWKGSGAKASEEIWFDIAEESAWSVSSLDEHAERAVRFRRQVKLIGDFKPDIIFVTPSYLLAILDEFHAQGIDPRKSSIKIAMCGAEPWTNAMRAEIEQAFDMHAVDIYGLSEVIGPGVAAECVETKDGLTVWEDHFYPEIIDPVTGKVLPDGELGELVTGRLHHVERDALVRALLADVLARALRRRLSRAGLRPPRGRGPP